MISQIPLLEQKARAENFPFCTIDPNIGKVFVPDQRLETLAKMANSAKITPSQMVSHKQSGNKLLYGRFQLPSRNTVLNKYNTWSVVAPSTHIDSFLRNLWILLVWLLVHQKEKATFSSSTFVFVFPLTKLLFSFSWRHTGWCDNVILIGLGNKFLAHIRGVSMIVQARGSLFNHNKHFMNFLCDSELRPRFWLAAGGEMFWQWERRCWECDPCRRNYWPCKRHGDHQHRANIGRPGITFPNERKNGTCMCDCVLAVPFLSKYLALGN